MPFSDISNGFEGSHEIDDWQYPPEPPDLTNYRPIVVLTSGYDRSDDDFEDEDPDDVPAAPAESTPEPEPPAQTDTGGGRDRPPAPPTDVPVPTPSDDAEPNRETGRGDTGDAPETPPTPRPAVEVTKEPNGSVKAVNHAHPNPDLVAKAAEAVTSEDITNWPDAREIIVIPPAEDLERTYHVDDLGAPTLFVKRTVFEGEGDPELSDRDGRYEVETAPAVQTVAESDEVQQMVQAAGFTKLTYVQPLASTTQITNERGIIQTTVYPFEAGRLPGRDEDRQLVDEDEQARVEDLAYRLIPVFENGGVEAGDLAEEQFLVRDTPEGPELLLGDTEAYRKFPEGDEFATLPVGEVRSFSHGAVTEAQVVAAAPEAAGALPGTTILGRGSAEGGPVLSAQATSDGHVVVVYDPASNEGVLVNIRPEDVGPTLAGSPAAVAAGQLPSLSKPGVQAHILGRVDSGEAGRELNYRTQRLWQALWLQRVRRVQDVAVETGDTIRLDLNQGRLTVTGPDGTMAYSFLPQRRRG